MGSSYNADDDYPCPPHGRSLEIAMGEGGSLKANILKKEYEAKMEILKGWGGRGFQTKQPSMVGMDIF